MTDKKKVYCGQGKKHEFDNGGSIIKLWLSPSDVGNLLCNVGPDGINLICGSRREPDERHGWTHYVQIDTWKPDKSQEPMQEQAQTERVENPADKREEDDNLPF